MMTEKLKEYLKDEINYQIYEHLKKLNINNFEEHFDYYYQLLSVIEKNYTDPLAVSERITSKWEESGLSYVQKFLYSDMLHLLMASKNYEAWQLKKIQQYFKDYNTKLKEEKKAKENREQFNTNFNHLKSAVNQLRTKKTEYLPEDDKEFQELLSKLSFNKENRPEKISLFKLPFGKKTNAEIINKIYVELQKAKLIDNTYNEFESHFFENNLPFVKLNWLGTKNELKAFVDLLIDKCKLYGLNRPNLLLKDHFSTENFSLEPRSFSSTKSDSTYLKIIDLKSSNHPLSVLFRKVWSITKDLDLG